MKFAAAALLALGVAADDRINVFNSSNKLYKNLMKSLVDDAVHKKASLGATGVVTWKQCADQSGVFMFDKSSTNTVPNPVTKGKDVKLNLAGTVSSTMSVNNIHVHVNWNGSSLYD